MANHLFSKEKLRKYFLEKRGNLSDVEVDEKSNRIVHRVLQSKEFSESSVVHSYLSIEKNNEVNTLPLIQACFRQDKKILVPKITGQRELDHIQISSLNNLEVNDWGVPEPIKGPTVSVQKIDLIIVPMVAGDRFKNRLGYGKGYYDNFLNGCSAVKMGLLFDCQLYDKKLPVESFDIPLDILITESDRIE